MTSKQPEIKAANELIQIDIPAPLLRAAAYYQAEQDPRHYLNGIYLSPEGYICATNGHCLFWAECEEARQLKEPLIIRACNAIPAKAETAHLQLSACKKSGYMSFTDGQHEPVKTKGIDVLIGFNLLDGKFPDVDRVMPKGELVATESIGVNAEYIGRAEKVSRALGARFPVVTIKLRGANSIIELQLYSIQYKAKIYVMPTRVE